MSKFHIKVPIKKCGTKVLSQVVYLSHFYVTEQLIRPKKLHVEIITINVIKNVSWSKPDFLGPDLKYDDLYRP